MKQNPNYFTTCFFLMLFGILSSSKLVAQPSNDECNAAINIEDLDNFCSSAAAFTNVNATPTQWQGENALSINGNDVWFQFTAVANTINLIIRGRDLSRPEVELLAGTDCDGEFLVLRSSSSTNSNVVELNRGGLIPGVTYFFRVQGLDEETGAFQICANNFFPPQAPGSDIEVASTLCNKSSFVIEQIEGAGNDDDEAAGTCLDAGGIFGGLFNASEQSSTWFTWIAANNGTLEFTLDPINPTDDLDFVIYELPNGLNNGTGKQPLRCMASSCEGPTGLSESSNDFAEDLGCEFGEDGFVRAIDMQEGVAYGLLINNFSESGNGFSITFGGTGEFQGPEPVIQAFIEEDLVDSATLCRGETISFDGRASSFGQGRITSYEWVFGTGATPATSRSANPGAVMYDEPGVKTVALTVTTEDGCQVSTVKEAIVTVDICCLAVDILADAIQVLPEDTTTLETTVLQALGTIQYQWTPVDLLSCVDCPNPTITTEENTTVVVMITDENGCEATDSIIIEVVTEMEEQEEMEEEVEEMEEEVMEISIPNAFTPNGDGFNDGFTVLGGAPEDRITSLQIFTRWGNLVFEANNIPLGNDELGWNGDYQGERLQPDVFIYRAVVAKADGEVADFTGDIMLIR